MKSTLKSENDLVMTGIPMIPDLELLGTNTLFRCDRCGAQAFTAAIKGELMLLWCRHHTNKNRETLESDGWEIDDRTHLLNENPSVSANV